MKTRALEPTAVSRMAMTRCTKSWIRLAPEVAVAAVLVLGFLLASALAARRLLVRSR